MENDQEIITYYAPEWAWKRIWETVKTVIEGEHYDSEIRREIERAMSEVNEHDLF